MMSSEDEALQKRIEEAFVNAIFFHIPYPPELPSPFEAWNAADYYEI